MRDLIQVLDLELRTPYLSSDHWHRSIKEQPLICSLSIETSISLEAEQDNLLNDSLNYGTVTKLIELYVSQLQKPTQGEGEEAQEGCYYSLEFLAEELSKVILFKANAPNVKLELRRPRALLSADSIGVSIFRSRKDYKTPTSSSSSSSPLSEFTLLPSFTSFKQDTFFIRGLRKSIVIGLNDCERLEPQPVILDFDFYSNQSRYEMIMLNRSVTTRVGWGGWRNVVKQLENHLETSKPLTVELITTSLAKIITTPPTPNTPNTPTTSQEEDRIKKSKWDVPKTRVKLSKPVAIMFAKAPSVSVLRERSDFNYDSNSSRSYSTNTINTNGTNLEKKKKVAFLGIGTNLGNRVENLSNALKRLRDQEEEDGSSWLKVVDTSYLYESEAMYHEDQDRFLNAAIKVETTLSPPELLNFLKRIESDLGRDFSTFRNGPRVIDLDLLLYDNETFEQSKKDEKDDRWLRVPHQGINEREFVLRPLVDIAPLELHPQTGSTLSEQLSKLMQKTQQTSTVQRVFPVSSRLVFPYSRTSSSTSTMTTTTTKNRTLLMSIINTTPDSFSDGGLNDSLPSALESCSEHLELGADVLDIGGMSTRPGASNVTEQEELERVLPLIKELRKDNKEVIISIDTFRARVAEEAIKVGADIINDVHGGREEGMFETMRNLGSPVILMHSRGDSSNMTQLTDYDLEGGVVGGVRKEMEQMVRKALEKGLNRWNIILDPGIGFAKTSKQNFELLKDLDKLFGESELLREFPVLVGLSRKKFLGPEKLDAKDRDLETAVGVTACIASGRCEIARIHDTKQMRDAVRVADQIYRS
ncbi:hypothetical protein JCM5350_006296 [Sporobolomyces pararoseus]